MSNGSTAQASTPSSGADRIVIHGQDFTEELAACDADDARIAWAAAANHDVASIPKKARRIWLASMGMTGQQRADFWNEFSSHTNPTQEPRS